MSWSHTRALGCLGIMARGVGGNQCELKPPTKCAFVAHLPSSLHMLGGVFSLPSCGLEARVSGELGGPGLDLNQVPKVKLCEGAWTSSADPGRPPPGPHTHSRSRRGAPAAS